jgi:hypothetical protein
LNARVTRALGACAKTIALVVVFACAAVAAVLIHLNLAASRRIAVVEVNRLLAPVFNGEMRIDDVRALSARGATIGRVTIDDEAQARVIEADDVSARIETWRLLRSLALRAGPIDVRVYDVSVRSARVSLASADDGALRVAKAMALKSKPAPSTTPARSVRFALDVALVGLHVYDAPRNVTLTGDVRGSLLVAGGELTANAAVSGDVSGVPIAFEGAYAKDRVDAKLSLEKVDAAKLDALAPEVALRGVAAAHVEAHGSPKKLAYTVAASLDEAALDARGEIVSADELRVTCDAEVARVNAAAIVGGVPQTALGAKGAAMLVRKTDGALLADAKVTLEPGLVGATTTPAITLAAKLDDAHASGTARVDEPGAPLDATFDLSRAARTLSFEMTSKAPDLAKVTRIAGHARGRLGWHAKGSVLLDAQTIDARFDADAAGIATGPVALGRARLDARVHGALVDPLADGTLAVTDLVASDVRVPRGVLRVSGPARRPRLTLEGEGPSETHFEAGAEVAVALPIDVRNAFARVKRDGTEISARVARVRVDGADVSVTGAEIEGLGQPARLDFEKRKTMLHVRLAAPRLHLARLAAFAKAPIPIGGRLDIDADVTIAGGRAHGKIAIDARRVHVKDVHKVQAHVDATFDGHRVAGDAIVEVPGVAVVRASTPGVTLAGDVTRAASWVRASGHADVRAELTLDRMKELLPEGTLPLTELAGTLGISATIDRDAKDAEPSIAVAASSHALVVATPKWRSAGRRRRCDRAHRRQRHARSRDDAARRRR